MSLKEIWKQFLTTTVVAASNCWKELKDVAKSTFDVFKDGLLAFVEVVFKWLLQLIMSSAIVIFELIKVVGAALLAAIKATLGLAYQAVINWIKHL